MAKGEWVNPVRDDEQVRCSMAKKKKKDRLTVSDVVALFAVCGVIGGIASKDVLMTIVMVAILIFIGWMETRKTTKQRKGIDTMNGLEFESFCAQQLAKSRRFRTVETTPPSGDFGADIVAVDKDGVRWVFQCKRYAQRLDNTPIQEVVGAMAHYNASRAGVITNSSFTAKARQLAKENHVELIEGTQFQRLIKQ